MVKVFYVGGSASSNGMLRAIVADWQIADLATSQAFAYLGAAFPPQTQGDPPSTIIEVSGERGETAWQPGFYRAEYPPQQFDDTLRSLEQLASSPVGAQAK